MCQKLISDKGESKAHVCGSAGRGLQLEKGWLGKASPCVFLKKIFLGLHWVFIAMLWLSLLEANRGSSSLQCAGFSMPGLLFLQNSGSGRVGFSRGGSWALEGGLSSCDTQA